MKRFLITFLMLFVLIGLCACGGDEANTEESKSETVQSTETAADTKAETESKTEAKSAFKVKVVDANGNPVSGVMVQLCKDTCIPAKTGDEGIASFNAEITDGYKVSVLSCPEGYEYTGEKDIYLQSGAEEITVVVNEVQ